MSWMSSCAKIFNSESMNRRVGNTFITKSKNLTFKKSLCLRCLHSKRVKKKKTYSLSLKVQKEARKKSSLELLPRSVNHKLAYQPLKIKITLCQSSTAALPCTCQRSSLSVRRWHRSVWTSRRVSSQLCMGSKLMWTQCVRTKRHSRCVRGLPLLSRPT